MLIRAATVLVVAFTSALVPSTSASGDDGPIVVQGDKFGGYVDTTLTGPGAQPKAPSAAGSSAHTNDSGVTCTWTEESDHAQSVWAWLGAGEPGGAWYDIRCSDGGLYIGVYVPPASGNLPPQVRLAGSLARTVVSRLQLPEPGVGQSPVGRALVGLPTWWWVEPGSWRVLRQRTSAGPVWAEVTATPVSSTWDPGDGSAPLVCAGPGTAYDRARPESEQSTDCSYIYRRSSAGQPQTGPGENDRFFTVTVTTTWQVTWTGSGGNGGTLPALTRSRSFPLAVAQRQTVVTGGSG